MNKSFVEHIKSRTLVFDGAMGSEIYRHGVFVNACYDELCVSRPDLVADIHRQYVAAGADVIETNTFGANRVKLAQYGIADKLDAINRAAVKLARAEAQSGTGVFVAGSCGPCGDDALHTLGADEFAAVYDEQIAIFADAGVDLVLLETFSDIPELLAVAACAKKHGLPVLASLNPSAFTFDEIPGAIRELAACPDIDAIGLNCGLGPAEMLDYAREAVAATTKPVVIMPNAGGPRDIGGRALYLNSPEYFTEYAKKYIEIGARGVGGCCGTTSDHIRMAAHAIHGLTGVKTHIAIKSAVATNSETQSGTAAAVAESVPFAEKSAFAAKLASGKPVTSVEMLPPRDATGLPAFIEKCRTCQAAGIDAINIPDGPRASARMSVVATAFAMRAAGLSVEPIPHCCSRDRNLIGLQSDIIGGVALGLKTWLFITGDPPKLGNYPDATGVFDIDAVGLTGLAANLNLGLDAAAQPLGAPSVFAIGVGLNPAAVDLERELDHFAAKVDAGAEYAITQPVFDAEALLRVLDRVAKFRIPIIAGLYPLLSFKNADFMNNFVPGVVVPEPILERMKRCTTKEAAIAEGIAIAGEIKRAVAGAVAGFQVSAPLGRTDIALSVLG